MNTTGHIIQGTWRRPTARQTDFNDLEHWVGLAKTLERGKFDAIFFADVVGLYAPYRGDERKYLEAGLQVPSNDPSVLASAIAYATQHLGIAFTASILQDHPFNFARRISTLDHASKGRIAWNIVTNYLPNASRRFFQGLYVVPGATEAEARRKAAELAPVLQQRGLMQKEYAEGSLRHKLFGRGDRLPERHPAARHRGAFAPQPA
jgi:alkanesulfonate monooxygenase SsuD/methylene tetrahydromethanopterin reductase-like flavin-dependent oxidoreductase (luciferase family)